MKRRLLLSLLGLSVLSACAIPSGHHSPQGHVDTAEWSSVQRELIGEWVEVGDHAGLIVGYRSVSRDSALLEIFGLQHRGAQANRQTLSVYHPDRSTLLMTHYCAQGNQARLRATQINARSVHFDFLDVTNADDRQSVLHELTLALNGDTLERVEVYRDADGHDDTSYYRFQRRNSAQSP